MPVAVRHLAAGLSDPGRKRENNEDRFWLDADRGIYLVVDGVGGQNAGEKAAETAVAMIRERLLRPLGTVPERVREAIALANNEILRLSQTREDWKGMACVLTLAVVEDGRATVGHVGDSRLYQLRGGGIRKITHDHSPVGEREDRGELTEIEAMRHVRRNEVYRDVGSEPHAPDDPNFVELVEIEMTADAALLLCSDGLSDLVPSATIRDLVEQNAGSPRAAAQALIAAANQAGGKDNITVIVVQGPRFAASAQPRTQADPVPQPSFFARTFGSKPAILLYGILLTLFLVAVFKPHFTVEDGRTVMELGPVQAAMQWSVGPGDQDFQTIASAMERARAGDTIVVAPGRYTEPVKLKSGVELVAEKSREAILTGGVSATQVKSVRFTGFTIEGGVALAASDVDLLDCDISNAPAIGVEYASQSNGTMTACRITNNSGGGIVIREGSAPRLVQNLVLGNGKSARAARPGIEIHDSAHPLLIDNVIADSGAEAIWTTPLIPEPDLLRRNFFGLTDPGKPNRRVRTVVR